MNKQKYRTLTKNKMSNYLYVLKSPNNYDLTIFIAHITKLMV